MTTPTALPTGTWELDPSATTLTVTARKLGLITVDATLAVTSGTVVIDDEHEVVDLQVVVDATSYASKNAKRNEHIVSEDFLDAGAHPTITFAAGSVTPTAEGLQADGSVTVKGQTSPVTVAIGDLDVTETVGSFVASATVDRTAIGVDKLPNFVIGRDLRLAITAKATKQA